MVYCLNPDCKEPLNPDGTQKCLNCGTPLLEKLDRRYRLLERIGEGGFGKTYKAEDTRLNILRLVKQLAPAQRHGAHEIDPVVVNLFRREAQLLKKLDDHPQIPSVVDFFDELGYLFLVQQLIEGYTLSKELENKGRYSEAEVRQFLKDLLPVLAFVHQHGVIHRDLKPDNIMRRSKDGRLVLIDFGVSTELDQSLQTHKSEIGPGTRGYMAYEQGMLKLVKPASDLFSVGAISFHLLTRISPNSLAHEYGFSWPQRWRDFLPQGVVVSEGLSKVMDGLLEQKYEQRYQSAQAVLNDLEKTVSPIVFPSPATSEKKALDPEDLTPTVATQNFTEDLNGEPLEMIYIPAGSFKMGSPEGGGRANELPQHRVNVPAFYLGKYPVTQAQYQAMMGTNPSDFKGKNHPVEQVSWRDAVEFCEKLTQKSGKLYRLPSEAEWEYACRAGTQTRYYFGDDEALLGEYAWYGQNSGKTTHPVGQKQPNKWGLYDMYGNVWEWCQDHWHENYQGAPTDGSVWLEKNDNRSRLLRGGSWVSSPRGCRSAYRLRYDADRRNYGSGFRVVCSAARTQS